MRRLIDDGPLGSRLGGLVGTYLLGLLGRLLLLGVPECLERLRAVGLALGAVRRSRHGFAGSAELLGESPLLRGFLSRRVVLVAYGVALGREKRLGGGALGLALLGGSVTRGPRGSPASTRAVVAVIRRVVVDARRGLRQSIRRGARSGFGLARTGVTVWRGSTVRFIAREHVCRDLQRVGAPTLDRLVGL